MKLVITSTAEMAALSEALEQYVTNTEEGFEIYPTNATDAERERLAAAKRYLAQLEAAYQNLADGPCRA